MFDRSLDYIWYGKIDIILEKLFFKQYNYTVIQSISYLVQ